jgi:NADPH2:quinone reductase
VDYTAPGWEDRVRAVTGGRGPDAVFDSVGGDIGRSALELVRDGGRFCVMGAASGSMTVPPDGEAGRRGLRMIGLGDVLPTPEAVRDAAATALAEAAAGRLHPTIGQTFPLSRAAEAHAAIEARATVGKTLLLP